MTAEPKPARAGDAEPEGWRKALEFYRDQWDVGGRGRPDDEEHWHPSEALYEDCGKRARQALAAAPSPPSGPGFQEWKLSEGVMVDPPHPQEAGGEDEGLRETLLGLAGWLQAKADVEMNQPAGLSVRDTALINGRIDAYREVRDQIIAMIKGNGDG